MAEPLADKIRCDRCGAPAVFEVEIQRIGTNTFQMLFLCNHHKNQHEPALAVAGYPVREIRGAKDAW